MSSYAFRSISILNLSVKVSHKLVWLAIGLVGLSGLMVAVTLSYLWEQAHSSGEQAVKAVARIVQEQTDRTLQSVDQRLQLADSQLSQMAATGTLSVPAAQAMLRAQIQEMPFVRAMWVMDAQGRIVYDSDDGHVGVNLADRAYFQIYQTQPQTDFHLGVPVKNKNGVWVISATRPLHHPDGRFAGIVVAALLPAYFDALWGAMELGDGASVAVYRRDATLLVHSPLLDTQIGQNFADLPAFAMLSKGQVGGAFEQHNRAEGVHHHFAYQALEHYPVVAVVGRSHAVILSGWTRMATLTVALWLAFSAVTIGLLFALARDLAARKKVETDLLGSKARLTAMLEAIPDLLFEVGVDGRYHDYHSPRSDLLAAPPEVFLGKLVSDVMPEPVAEVIMLAIQEAHQKGTSSGHVIALELPVGTRWFELSAARKLALPGESPHCMVLSRDITARVQNKMELSASLAERTALLNEVHHRVKNNLQVITSLLRLEGARSGHADTKTVLQDMTGRIRSMALLHESLYRSGIFAQVDLGQYLKTLAQQAFRANATSGTAVQILMDLATVMVSLDLAGPAGLLVNELISNSLKHGFPQGRAGVVRFTLQPESGTRWCLTLSDSGVGLPADFDTRRAGSLGMQLVSDLTLQIGGTLHVDAHGGEQGGALFRICFEVVP